MTAKKIKGPKSWQKVQDRFADDTSLAVVLADGEGLSNVAESNNNSICRVLTRSDEFRGDCQRFCGSVFQNVTETGKAVKYKCHAGLECVAVPLLRKNKHNFVAIVGRAFTKASDYREATERAVSGDWSRFPSTKFFENILMSSSSANIERLGERLDSLSEDDAYLLTEYDKKETSLSQDEKETEEVEAADDLAIEEDRAEPDHREPEKGVKNIQDISVKSVVPEKGSELNQGSEIRVAEIETQEPSKVISDKGEFNAWHRFIRSIHEMEYDDACRSVLAFMMSQYGISSVAWLENIDNYLRKVHAVGDLEKQKIRISLASDDQRLLNVFRKRTSIKLKAKNGSDGKSNQTIRLFPVSVRKGIRSALALGEGLKSKKARRQVARFCQVLSWELEILRLRSQISRQSKLDEAYEKFNESLAQVDSNAFWKNALKTVADLVKAGRGSLLVYDEKEEELAVRAAIGKRAAIFDTSDQKIGERIAKKVWRNGKPLVVADIKKIGLPAAPPEWEYDSGSFISYPLSIGDRRVGVLNVTDKTDGGIFNISDLDLLKAIVPQLSVAIDRASLKSKAGKFEQLSVTDPLTGLLNRRYLEERLTEEIKRSDRHGYPMSFLMIDVDNFKTYNDAFTHPEGDKALQLVGQCLRESLREADVAARYGGEEFSILLPQTNLEEARIIAERIRRKIATTTFPNRQVTVSIGITGASSGRDTAEGIISAADKALFAAKRKGKNNVQIYEYVRKNLNVGN